MQVFNSLIIIGSWIIICLILAILCRKSFPSQRELSRKIVHIGIGPIVPLAWWLEIPSEIAITAATIITFALIINYKFRLIPEVEDIQRQSYGTIAYATSITLLLIFFWHNNPSAVSAGVLMMAFGDGLAGLLGRHIPSPSWKIFGQRKSMVGTGAMGLVGLIVLFSLALSSGLSIYPLRIIAITALAVSLEQISLWGVDNFSVPLAVAFAWQLFITT